MAAPRGAIRNWTEYIAVLGLIKLAQLAPAFVLLGLARGLSRLACWLLRERRRRTRSRIEAGLGLKPQDPRVEKILEGAYLTLALNAVEAIIVERRLARGATPGDFMTIEGGEHLERAFASGKGVLICTGHFGAWELIPVFLARLYVPIWAMARPLSNPLLERYLSARRLHCVRGAVSKDGGGLKFARIMRAGEPLGLLLDQNAGSSGVILDFLGLPSSHHTVSGVMAQRFGAEVLPVYLIHERRSLRYHMVVEPPITADPRLPVEESQLDVVRRLSRSLEDRVRAHPEQWLWLHDRWRHAERVLRLAASGQAPSADARRDASRPAPAGDTHVPVAQGTNGA